MGWFTQEGILFTVLSHFTHRFIISGPIGYFWILIYYWPTYSINLCTELLQICPIFGLFMRFVGHENRPAACTTLDRGVPSQCKYLLAATLQLCNNYPPPLVLIIIFFSFDSLIELQLPHPTPGKTIVFSITSLNYI